VGNRIGFIGAGQMAQALASGFVQSGQVDAASVSFYDPAEASISAMQQAISGGTSTTSATDVIEQSDVVFLAVKPQVMPRVITDIKDAVTDSTLVVSIAAGITLSTLCDGLGSTRIIRVMPNTPCLVSTGACAYASGAGATDADRTTVDALLSAVGIAVDVPETYMDAVTGLSGSGPAYIYTVIEALSDGGVAVGLPRATATALAAQMVKGAAEMVLETGKHPGELKDQVTSPGGTTIAGLRELKEAGISGAFMSAVAAATKRSKELG